MMLPPTFPDHRPEIGLFFTRIGSAVTAHGRGRLAAVPFF